MCLAIYKPAGKDVPQLHLRNGFDNHSDGSGIAWAEDGVLKVKKGIFNINDFLEAYEKVKQFPCLIHFRKSTSGKIDTTNCHPFLFNDDKLALIHNGVLNIKCSMEGLSDTAHFVKQVLEPLIKTCNVPINHPSLNYLICTSIGSDKMVVMDGSGKTYIFNQNKGNWENGIWYSNTSFNWSNKSYINNNNNKYFNNNNNQNVSNINYNKITNHHNFHKHWKDDESGDESYLEFWKKVGTVVECEVIQVGNNNGSQGIGDTNNKRSSHLLEDSKLNHTVVNVDELIEEIDENDDLEIDAYGNVIKKYGSGSSQTYEPGRMCEYGWYDEAVEEEVKNFIEKLGISREEAVIRIFNEK